MERYLLFGGEHYGGGEGWNQFVGAYTTVEGAIFAAIKSADDSEGLVDNWFHVVDTAALSICQEGSKSAWGDGDGNKHQGFQGWTFKPALQFTARR